MQSIWGYRLFDFWCFKLGIAIEVGQSEHGKDYDLESDQYEYARSGIKVIRVRALNEEDMTLAIEEILMSETWNERRAVLKLKPINGN
jgi:very-short-patch-repair endonuclease